MISRFHLPLLGVLLLVVSTVQGWAYPTVYGTDPCAYANGGLYGYDDMRTCNWSYPTIYGDTGLVLAPTADVEPYEGFALALDYTQTSTDLGNSPAVPVRLDYGVAPNAEIFAFFSDSGSSGFDAFGGGVKVRLVDTPLDSSKPSLAVGARAIRLQNSIEQDIVNAYAVTSVPLLRYGNSLLGGYRVRGHLGVDFLDYSNDLSGNFVMPFVGLSYEDYHGTSLVVDYLPRLRDDGVTFRSSTVSAAVRFPLSSIFTIEAGGTRPFATGDNSIYAGLMYHYDGYADTSSYPDASVGVPY